MFGHTIHLNFNKQGDSHKTLIGGVFSFVIRLIMFIYVVILFKRLFLNEGDNNFTKLDVLDLEEFGKIKLSDTNLTVFHVLKK